MKISRKRFLSISMLTIYLSSLILSLSGCSDYRGLDEMTIVAGMAIDFNQKGGDAYRVSLEILDNGSQSEGDNSLKSTIVEFTGESPAAAIYTASEQLRKQMYFGNMGIIIIGHQILSEQGLNDLMDGIMRSFKIRDTVSLIVSREDSARVLFDNKQSENGIISYMIQENFADQIKSPDSIRSFPIYKIYNYLATEPSMYYLTIPAFSLENTNSKTVSEGGGKENGTSQSGKPNSELSKKGDNKGEEEKKTLVSNGMAVFENDMLTGWFDQTYMPAYMFLTEGLKDGAFVFTIPEDERILKAGQNKAPNTVTLELQDSKQDLKCLYENGKFILKADLRIRVSIISAPPTIEEMDEYTVDIIKAYADAALEERLTDLIESVQKETGQDIFGFGKYLYRHHTDLWRQVSENWKLFFADAEVDVSANIIIEDSGMMKRYRAG